MSKIVNAVKKYHWNDCFLRLTVYMISDYSYVKIYFPATRPKEILYLLESMEKQGYRECGWFRWWLHKIYLDIKKLTSKEKAKISTKDNVIIEVTK